MPRRDEMLRSIRGKATSSCCPAARSPEPASPGVSGDFCPFPLMAFIIERNILSLPAAKTESCLALRLGLLLHGVFRTI
jgi:hypothetical protein